MATAQSKQPRKTRETLNLRIRAEDRALIDNAAKVRGKTRTDFILDTVRVAAESALLEQAFIQASPAAFTKFLERLDAPPNPNARLKKTLQTPAPWENK